MLSNGGVFLYYITVNRLVSFHFLYSSKHIYKDFA